MKNFTIAATLFVASFSALADGATYDYPQPITSNISRAEVQAQTAAAAARGELVGGELSYVAPRTGRALSRLEVRVELAAARANDELIQGERVFVAETHPRRDSASVLAAKTNVTTR